jgi:hypothetical protein
MIHRGAVGGMPGTDVWVHLFDRAWFLRGCRVLVDEAAECLQVAAADGLVMVGGACRSSGGVSPSVRCGRWVL